MLNSKKGKNYISYSQLLISAGVFTNQVKSPIIITIILNARFTWE